MKKFLVLSIFALLMSWTTINSHALAIAERDRSVTDFYEITGKEWKLIEVYIDREKTQFNRDDFLNETYVEGQTFILHRFSPETFTLTFDEQRLSGTGAPNRYSAPYTLGDKQTISIMPMLSTMMAPLFELESLREYDFYVYLTGVQKWDLVNGNFELYSKTEDGREIRLVFGL
ncbi:MAG: META domain-containing protein [Treponema sp.]|nr:META domain-containing protein [Treponema sp.]